MKFVCEKSELLKAVNIVSKAVPGRTTLPILECILIDCSSGNIKLTANDMELGIETILGGEIIEKGTAAVEAKFFSSMVRNLPENEVIIETDDLYQVKISCGNFNTTIAGRAGDDFSLLPVIEKSDSIVLSQFALKEVINKTIFCTADNEGNKMMSGELFEVKGDKLRVIALDGHRIAIRRIELKESYSDHKVIIPAKTLNEINKIISGDLESDVTIYFNRSFAMFEFESTKVVTRLIEGDYFNVDQMLSTDYETKIVVNRKDLKDCNDRASLFVNEGDKKPIIMNIADNKINLSINTMLGSMNEKIDIKQEGKDLVIGFNPKFILDALNRIDDEEIDIYMINPKAPCYIRDEDNSYIYLILPVNFNAGR